MNHLRAALTFIRGKLHDQLLLFLLHQWATPTPHPLAALTTPMHTPNFARRGLGSGVVLASFFSERGNLYKVLSRFLLATKWIGSISLISHLMA